MSPTMIGNRPNRQVMGYAGESRTWDLLNEFAPAEWTVFYEPYLARSDSELSARIPDFVIVVPGNGVMVMDVKGLKGDDVRVENRTIWGQYGDGEKKDLVKQVKAQAQKLRDTIRRDPRVRERFPYSSFNLVCALGFSAWSFAGADGHRLRTSPEGWERWNVVESTAYADGPAFIARIAQALNDQRNDNRQISPFTVEDAAEFTAWFRSTSHKGRTDFAPGLSSISSDLERFTEEQLDAQNQASAIDKYWLDSPMSTGKTWVATRRAVREALQSRRVGFLMERKPVAEKIKRTIRAQMDEWGTPDLTAGAAPLLHIATISSVLNNLCPGWRSQKDLDVVALQVVHAKDAGKFSPYDVLVLDQAEDYLLNQPKMINVLAELVQGGLGSGKIKIFSDIVHQGHTSIPKQAALVEHLSSLNFTKVKGLTTNCRNPAPIVEYLNKLLARSDNPDLVFTKWLTESDLEGEVSRPVVRTYPATVWYPSWLTDDPILALPPGWYQVQELVNEIRRLKDLGIAPNKIAILTAMPRNAPSGRDEIYGAERSSPAFVSKGVWDWSIAVTGATNEEFSPKKPFDLSGLGPAWVPIDWKIAEKDIDGLHWYTVEEFRGGEEQVVIVTDLDQQSYKNVIGRHLVSGVSRSQARIIVIANNLPQELRPVSKAI